MCTVLGEIMKGFLVFKCRNCGERFEYETTLPISINKFRNPSNCVEEHICYPGEHEKMPDVVPERHGIGDLIGWKIVHEVKKTCQKK